MERRKFLGKMTVLTAGIAGLAGCGSPDEPAEGTGTETEIGGDETATEIGGDETATEIGGDETETETETGTEGATDLEGMVGETPDNIEVSDTQLQQSGGEAVVTGTVENTGEESIEEVEVQVTLLDDNDEIIGQFFHDTEEAEVESLEAGATWDFSVSFPGEDLEDAAAYRIDVDTEIDDNVDFGTGTETETTTTTTTTVG